MNCKNCQQALEENDLFCDNCGAKVIKNRITFKELTTDAFINIFGVDSKFFLTLKKMVTHPDVVINEYLTGVRKRYINPFAFLAIAAGLSVLVFNFFAEEFTQLQEVYSSNETKAFKEKANIDIKKFEHLPKKELNKLKAEKKVAQMQLDFMEKMWQFMLHYFNLLTFLFLIIYALISKWTYPKPHNFGEHIIINAYIYGFTSYFTLIMFLLALVIHPTIYGFSLIMYFVYYIYAFGKLYKLSFGKLLLKFLRFLIGLFIFSIITLLLFGLIGFVMFKLEVFKF